MQNQNYKAILYFIGLVILITLSIQLYWNYKNFQTVKQQLINEVQISIDNAIDAYYVDLADRNTVGISFPDSNNLNNKPQLDSLFKFLDRSGTDVKSTIDSLDPKKISELKIFRKSEVSGNLDSVLKIFPANDFGSKHIRAIFDSINQPRLPSDSVFKLASKVIISITTDTLQTPLLNTFIKEQLLQKNIDVAYGYIFKNNSGNIQKFNSKIIEEEHLSSSSKSAYLPRKSSFDFYFTTNTGLILKRNILGLLLSALLIICVIGCLLFLLKIINRQKQLAEMKNDLISNITHEFKTPISVIHVALEGMSNFNASNDPKKNKNYLKISQEQLGKLEIMVEKLLETAMLEGNSMELKKVEFFIDDILLKLISKYQNLKTDKEISTLGEIPKLKMFGDAFHLENALNNILDNALKYGGNHIFISAAAREDRLEIKISDDGNSLTTEHLKHIFDKFYRVPKGNTHDIKGYGIGLYYTKKIIQGHNGEIDVILRNNTTFLISLPYEQ